MSNSTHDAAPQGKARKPKRVRPRRGRVFPAPDWSARAYVRVARSDVALFRFLLEAWDNLALFTVVDRAAGILMLRFSAHQEREVRLFLEAARSEIAVEPVCWPGADAAGAGPVPPMKL
ncbi:DUF4911 domain-containing protein [Paucidesulfovibrio longus]|uniref:DUF4911 domain-containing protein n=1 Tax=Paucidesulfovibrio longus TaxID=889 RepID=UPI0003B4E836|nr:DUF4911 domain-containing protein [Paucidesulfovibrio longus]